MLYIYAVKPTHKFTFYLNVNIMLLNKIYNQEINEIYQPVFYLNTGEGKTDIEKLIAKGVFLHDGIYEQLKELLKIRNPKKKLTADDYEVLINAHLGATELDEYGVWVHYPWSGNLVHLLDKDEFIEVRTNRNKYKITSEEQALLAIRSIGIVGLSVGQSIAITIAMERVCGTLRLADFDTAELSNLNRLRTGVHNLGLRKTVIAAREIAEIDPYLNVEIYNEGLTDQNIDNFFLGNGKKLDLLVEVCDGLDIKVISRFKARELGIPVVMDTNDRGMLDVERFDLEPSRPIFHGLAGDLDPNNIKGLTNEEKIPYILKMVGTDTLSMRLKASMMEVEQSINTWPQLASSVVLGGALVADVVRRIFLDHFHDSGRYYIDLDDLIKDKNEVKHVADHSKYAGPEELNTIDIIKTSKKLQITNERVALTSQQINDIIIAAVSAPSGGNVQPWKYIYRDDCLFVFHDEHFSYSLLDFNNLGSYIALGAAIENISVKAASMNLGSMIKYFPLDESIELVAVVTFTRIKEKNKSGDLEPYINLRFTNRNTGESKSISEHVFDELAGSLTPYDGASLQFVKGDKMHELGELLATTEMLRILHDRGHHDTFKKEVRWTPEENLMKKDGIDIQTMGISQGEAAALRIAEDADAIGFLKKMQGGEAFKKMVRKSVACASAIGIVTMPEYSELNFLKGGRAVEHIWLQASKRNISFQPITQLVFLLERLKRGNGEGLDDYFQSSFNELHDRLYELLPGLKNQQLIFIFRLCIAEQPAVKSYRRDIESVFTHVSE